MRLKTSEVLFRNAKQLQLPYPNYPRAISWTVIEASSKLSGFCAGKRHLRSSAQTPVWYGCSNLESERLIEHVIFESFP